MGCEKYIQHTLLRHCVEFLEERSAMVVLLSTLSFKQKGQPSIKLPTPLKYHCKLAGGDRILLGSITDSIAILKLRRKRQRVNSRIVWEMQWGLLKMNMLQDSPSSVDVIWWYIMYLTKMAIYLATRWWSALSRRYYRLTEM